MDTPNETDTTDATRPRRDEHDTVNATAGPLVLSVADAAGALGISAGAVRKRIERGQLQGQKLRGQWQVVLEQLPVDATDTTSATRQQNSDTTRQDTSNTTTSVVLQTEADRYAAMVAPFLDRLEAQAERIGALEAELAAVTAERDQLQASAAPPQDAESRASDAEAATPDAGPVVVPATRTGRFWRSWWPWRR